MDKPKTKVVKSKSSNSAITTKSEPRKHNKKSRSNAEFQPLVLKKRGVYVEKKDTKISIKETNISPVVIPIKPSSPRAIPRAGRKRFLASVLTILSQSTTGTQYPDHDDPDRLKKIDRNKTKLKRRKEEEMIKEDTTSTANILKKKQKYRSKVLNDADSEFEQLVVLQSTKEITHTPSNISVKSSTNNYREPDSIKLTDIIPPLAKNAHLANANVIEENKERQGNKEKRVKLVDKDPSTLVAEVPKKDEKKLYNFFVDLLETTFNVYNVKTEFHPPPVSSVTSSKVALEMDESVAKKLNIQKAKEPPGNFEDVTREPSKYFYCIKPDPNEVWDDQQLLDHFQPKAMKRTRPVSPTKSFKRNKRFISESIDCKKAKPIPTTNSLIIPNSIKKITLKKDRKKTFMNLLKEQLKMEADVFEEPQNFFQALKVMARNKRRCQKSIHFNPSTKKSSEGDVHVCQFKRRRLLSASTNSSGKKSNYHPESDIIRSMRSFSRNSGLTTSSKKRTTITITETSENEIDEIEPSQHSLEVFGYDYETNVAKKMPKPEKSFVMTRHSSVSTSEHDYNVAEALLKFSDSGSSSMMGSHSRVAGKHGLRSLSELLE